MVLNIPPTSMVAEPLVPPVIVQQNLSPAAIESVLVTSSNIPVTPLVIDTSSLPLAVLTLTCAVTLAP